MTIPVPGFIYWRDLHAFRRDRIIHPRFPISHILVLGSLLFAGGVRAAERLDQKAVHGEYENGNFDSVLGMIAVFEKRNPRYPKDDSLFIAKHLSVIYAANPKTVEIGKHWMHRMLSLTPGADLSGMYVNEDIDRIFDKVQREFMARQAAAGVDVSALRAPAPAGSMAGAMAGSPPESDRKAWIWAGAAGTAALAAAAIAFAAFANESQSEKPSLPDIEVGL